MTAEVEVFRNEDPSIPEGHCVGVAMHDFTLIERNGKLVPAMQFRPEVARIFAHAILTKADEIDRDEVEGEQGLEP